MSTTAEYAAIPASASNNRSEFSALDRAQTSSRRMFFATLVIAPAVALVILPAPNSAIQDVAQLERIASEIERTPSLSAEARDAIGRIATRTGNLAELSNPSQEARRKAAIERVNSALRATQSATVGQSGGNATGR